MVTLKVTIYGPSKGSPWTTQGSRAYVCDVNYESQNFSSMTSESVNMMSPNTRGIAMIPITVSIPEPYTPRMTEG